MERKHIILMTNFRDMRGMNKNHLLVEITCKNPITNHNSNTKIRRKKQQIEDLNDTAKSTKYRKIIKRTKENLRLVH